MPIYEYRCGACGFENEYLQKVTDPLLTTCPECGQATFKKKLTAAGFQLKGSGWYATDFKDRGSKPAEKKANGDGKAAESGSKAGGDAASGGDSKSDSGSKDAAPVACGSGACPSCS